MGQPSCAYDLLRELLIRVCLKVRVIAEKQPKVRSSHTLEMVAALPRMASVWSAYVQMALTFFLSHLVKRGSYRLGWVLQLLIRWF